MPRGTVATMNPSRGMVAVETEDGGFTVFELMSNWELEAGDLISWSDRYGMGTQLYRNLTKATSCEVYVQNHDVQRASLARHLLL